MKKLGLAVAMLALTQIACIIDTGTDEGAFTVSWDVTAGGTQVDFCADVGAAAVSSLATDQLDSNIPPMAYDDVFRNCDAWSGVTDLLPYSDYTVVWALLDDTDQVLTATSEPAPFDVTLASDLQALPLATFDFPPLTATVTFDVDFGAAGGNNCAGGELVDWQETVFFASPGGQCTDYTIGFDGVSTGCTDGSCDVCAGNYAPCPELSVAQTISGLVDGDYTLEVSGVLDCGGGVLERCYVGTVSFSIVGGANFDQGTVDAPFTNSGACQVCKSTR